MWKLVSSCFSPACTSQPGHVEPHHQETFQNPHFCLALQLIQEWVNVLTKEAKAGVKNAGDNKRQSRGLRKGGGFLCKRDPRWREGGVRAGLLWEIVHQPTNQPTYGNQCHHAADQQSQTHQPFFSYSSKGPFASAICQPTPCKKRRFLYQCTMSWCGSMEVSNSISSKNP